MKSRSNNLLEYILLRIYCRLPRENSSYLKIRELIRKAYFRPRIQKDVRLDKKWLDEYFDLLIWFDGTCNYIDSKEAVTTLVSRFNLNKNNIIHIRVNPSSDLGILYQIWEFEDYKPIIEQMQQFVDVAGKLNIIDAGANVGYTTLYLKNRFPNARILSLEPDSSNYEQLERNIITNDLNGVKPIKAGLWKNKAYLKVSRDFRDGTECSFYVEESASPTDLFGYSLQDILVQEQWSVIDLLKIDIEGSERYLFDSSINARRILQNVRFIAMEIHDEFNIRDDIYNYLEENGFEIYEKGELTFGRNTKIT